MEAGGEWDVDSVHVEDLVGAVHFGGEREAIGGGKCDGGWRLPQGTRGRVMAMKEVVELRRVGGWNEGRWQSCGATEVA